MMIDDDDDDDDDNDDDGGGDDDDDGDYCNGDDDDGDDCDDNYLLINHSTCPVIPKLAHVILIKIKNFIEYTKAPQRTAAL